jgi:predicted transcriptional regulator
MLTLRLSKELEQLLDDEASRRGINRSALIRLALIRFLKESRRNALQQGMLAEAQARYAPEAGNRPEDWLDAALGDGLDANEEPWWN